VPFADAVKAGFRRTHRKPSGVRKIERKCLPPGNIGRVPAHRLRDALAMAGIAYASDAR
jgi:hypothetical protein